MQRGDRVGIWAPNCIPWFLVQYATARIGAILVNINPAYRTHELEYVLKQAGIATLVSAVSFKTSEYRQMIEEVRGKLPDLQDVVYIDDPSWDELLAAGASVSAEQVRERADALSFDDPINIQYTSGTTGLPEGRDALAPQHPQQRLLRRRGDGLHRAGPHLRPGALLSLLRHGDGQSRLDLARRVRRDPGAGLRPAATLRAVQQEKCTSLYGVPTMFIAELALPDFAEYDLSSLRTGCMAGSPCPVEVMKRVITEMNMDEVTIAYGMTETSPVSTQTRKDDSLDRRTGSVGACTRTSRSWSSTRTRTCRCRAASRASCARGPTR